VTEPTHTVVVRAEATDTDSIEARIEHAGEPSPELLADLTLSAADTFERVHGRKPSRVLVEVLPLGESIADVTTSLANNSTDKGDLRSQGVRPEGSHGAGYVRRLERAVLDMGRDLGSLRRQRRDAEAEIERLRVFERAFAK
jgi:hypothetical protein